VHAAILEQELKSATPVMEYSNFKTALEKLKSCAQPRAAVPHEYGCTRIVRKGSVQVFRWGTMRSRHLDMSKKMSNMFYFAIDSHK
jgi:hypothetical protein